MDKPTSLVAALDAGKLPSTNQLSAFITYVLNDILPPVPKRSADTGDTAGSGSSSTMKGIAADDGVLGKISNAMARVEDSLSPTGDHTATKEELNEQLSAQGSVLAGDVKALLEAYAGVLQEKNADDVVQESLYALSGARPELSDEAGEQLQGAGATTAKSAAHDLATITNVLRTLVSTLGTSFSSESSSLLADVLSYLRVSLADAASSIATTAQSTSDTLHNLEEEVQDGKRDALGRDRERLREEEEGGAEVKWEHGMDQVRDAGSGVIRGVGKVGEMAKAGEKAGERGGKRVLEGMYKIADRAQKDPAYKQALDDLFKLLQARLDGLSALATKLDPKNSNKEISVSSFIVDASPEREKLDKALAGFKTLIERLSNDTPLDPFLEALRRAARVVLKEAEDEKNGQGEKGELKKWFDDALRFGRRMLGEPGYVRSEDADKEREALGRRWVGLYTGTSEEWRNAVDGLRTELGKLVDGFESDPALVRLRAAHAQFAQDLERGWKDVKGVVGGVKRDVEGRVKEEVSEVAESMGMSPTEMMHQATWFWQDLFRVYVPRVLAKLRDVSVPRTEYKDPEIEFVLENLDISSFNLQPSHTYIRNITDIDVQASSLHSHTAIGTLTHIRVQALQISLKDVSFWYKDKSAGMMAPSEFTGLLGVELPEKGVNVDLKVRLIPRDVQGPQGRKERRHFHIIEQCTVSISDDVRLEVRESNHSVLVTLFRPVVVGRVKEALERTLGEWLRSTVEWLDSVAWDVGVRQEVFLDTGLGKSASLFAAVWSEVGRLERHASQHKIHVTEEDGVTQREDVVGVSVGATGTGLVARHERRIGVDALGEGEREKRETVVAVGAEPQILGPEKRGPLGSGSEYISDKVEKAKGEIVDAAGRMAEEAGVDVDMDMEGVEEVRNTAQGMVGEAKGFVAGAIGEGRRELDGFRRAVLVKSERERKREGWRSDAFDI